jgi:hypothetical protein
MIHELNIGPSQFARIDAGQVVAKVVLHDKDYQASDELHFYESNDYGHRLYHYEDRDEKGRFSNQRVENPPVRVQITHVLPAAQCEGLVARNVLLSFVLLED